MTQHDQVDFYSGPSYLVVLRRCWRPVASLAILGLMAYFLLAVPTGALPSVPGAPTLSGTSVHLLSIGLAMLLIVGLRGLPVIIPALLAPFVIIESRIDTPSNVASWYGQEAILLLVALSLFVATLQSSRVLELLIVSRWEKLAGHWERLRWQAWGTAFLMGLIVPAPLVWSAHHRAMHILASELPPHAPSRRLEEGLRYGITWFSTIGSMCSYFGFHLFVVVAAAGLHTQQSALTPFQVFLHCGAIGVPLGFIIAALMNWRFHLHGLRAGPQAEASLARERRRLGRLNWTKKAIIGLSIGGFILALIRPYSALVPIVLGVLMIIVGTRMVPWRMVRSRVVWEYAVLMVSFMALTEGMMATETSHVLARSLEQYFNPQHWIFWVMSAVIIGSLRQVLPVFGVLCISLPIAAQLIPNSPFFLLTLATACIRLPDLQARWRTQATSWTIGLIWWTLWSTFLWLQHLLLTDL